MSSKFQQGLYQYGDKILFSLASLYFLLVISWLIYQNQLKLPFSENKQQNTTSEKPSASDKAFISYLQARLATIDTTPSPNSETENIPKSPTIQGNVPSVSVSPPPPPPQSTTPSVIERVYIPLYPETPQVTSPPQPTQTIPSPPQNVPLPPPPASSTPPLQSVPVLSPNNPTMPEITALRTQNVSVLVGALASGDRSYAILQVNGKPKQIRIGEIIDQRGWMLVKVENQQITLQKSGKQRIVSVGDEL